MKYCKFSRRMFLQGAGGTLFAIPFLQSLLPREAWAQTAAPKRYVGMVSNYDLGHGRNWFPTQNVLGRSMTVAGHASVRHQPLRELLGSNPRLSTILGSGLNAHLGSLNLFKGLDVVPYFGHGWGHNLGNTAGVVSNTVLSSMAQMATIDQALGRNSRINPKASEPFLFTNIDSASVSYGPDGSGRIVRKASVANSAAAIYNTLFRGGSVPETGQSSSANPRRDVLSRVLEDYSRVRTSKQISTLDKIVLDNAFDKLSEVQRNIAQETQLVNGCSYKSLPRPAGGTTPYASATAMKNMADLIVAAMQCDVNRVFLFSGWIDETYYNKSSSDFHGSHTHEPLGTVAGKLNWQYMGEIQAGLVNNFLVPLLNGMSAAIDAENGQSILYNSLVHLSMEHSTVHSSADIPSLLAGNAGGALTSGNMIDYSDRAATAADNYDLPNEGGWSLTPSHANYIGCYYGIPYNRLLVTILQAMGLSPGDYERSDLNTYYRNRTDGALGTHNNNIASVGGYGAIGAVNPQEESWMMWGHKRYNRFNYHYYKDKLPMPPSST